MQIIKSKAGGVLLSFTMSTLKKVLIVEERDMLREKIAGILSREESISMVIQVSSYAMLHRALRETAPDLVFGDLLELRRFCKKTGISAKELCPDANILLYTDEYKHPSCRETEYPGEKYVFDVRHIQQEVSDFLKGTNKNRQIDE